MFSERLKRLRKERGLTQDDLAEELGVSRSSVSGYETNRAAEPDYRSLVKIADLFQVSTDYLLGRTDDPRLCRNQESMSLQEFCDAVGDALSRVHGYGNMSTEDRQRLIEIVRYLLELVRRN